MATPILAKTKFGLAQPVRRVEDPRLLKGMGRYTDDIVLPGMLHGIVLRSPHAAATINAIDTTAAKSRRRSARHLYRGRPAEVRVVAVRGAGAEQGRLRHGQSAASGSR